MKIINIAEQIVKKGEKYFVFPENTKKSVDKKMFTEYHTHCKEQRKYGITETELRSSACIAERYSETSLFFYPF